MACGKAAPNDKQFELHAKEGDPCAGISSSPFLDYAFKTVEFHIQVSINADGTWSYEQDTVLKIKDQEYTTEDIVSLLKKYRLFPQIAKEIIIDQSVGSIEIEPEKINHARLNFYQANGIKNPEQLEQWLKMQDISEENLEYLMVRDLKIEKFKQQSWGDQLESYFLQYKERFDQVVYSLIRTKDKDLAKELYFRLSEGESDFAQLAKEYSQGNEASTGGIIGPVELNTPHPSIIRLLNQSQIGQISLPTAVEEWVVIVRLEKYISAELNENMQQRLLGELFQNWLTQQTQEVRTLA
jgi:parvulin-like peptidyl-prolyl isomerase